VLLPRQPAKLARGAKDEEHAMSQQNARIAVVGIDIGKNSFHISAAKWSRSRVEARFANMLPLTGTGT